MSITVIVRSTDGGEERLTFDRTQRIVIGRGAASDVRIPDPSVSHRHASLRAQGSGFALVDEGSSNGTFVGGVRIAPRTSRLVRSGDLARLGRVWIELRLDHAPITRDLAVATRDLALAMVGRALDAMGHDRTMCVTVVEGSDQGARLPLDEEGRAYVVGRGIECDLPLAEVDASRHHAQVVRTGGTVVVRNLRAKNGTWVGDSRLTDDQQMVWRPAQLMRVGRSVLALREPVSEALALIEQAPDEPVAGGEKLEPPSAATPQVLDSPAPSASAAPIAPAPAVAAARGPAARPGWGAIDLAVMAAAIGILVLSIAGLVWLLRS